MCAQNKGSQFYIDNGCSKHMTRDQNKFINSKERKEGKCYFWR